MDIHILDNLKIPILIWKRENDTFICEYSNVSGKAKYLESEKLYLYESVMEQGEAQIQENNANINLTRIDDDTLMEIHYPQTDYLSVLYSINEKVRAPLTNIIGILSIMEKQDMNPEQKKYHNIMQNSSREVVDVANDLVDIINIDRGNVTLSPRKISINRLINSIMKSIYGALETKDIEFEISTDKNVPNDIILDMKVLAKVIAHMIINAIENMTNGNIKINIKNDWKEYIETPHIYLEPKDDEINILFEIYNDNPNIDPSVDKVLNALLGLNDNTTTPPKGTGMGLIICKKLVKLMKGDIWYQRHPGVGISFYFNIIANK